MTRPPEPAVFQSGDVIASRFRIIRYIAKGGMGELYEAEDLELHERVALKTILSGIASDERAIAMFKREVHLARQVTHPNVCRIYDVFRHRPDAAAGPAGEVVFLSMELLHGETLAEKLRRDGRLPVTEILPILRQMAGGLSAAHRAGIVHRDFKSHNVMLVTPAPPGQGLRVVVTDFGLARRDVQEERTMSLSLGDAGDISGTPAYMAPEQIEGGPVTPATDIYALGVVLYEMVTGVWPFVGETPLATALKRLQQPAPPPTTHVPDVDRRFEATILRCLARRPEDRFAQVADVVADLDAPRAPRPTQRSKMIAASVAAIALAVVVAGVLYWRSHRITPLTDKDTIVLADFVNTTGDGVFDSTLKQALAIQLQQSPFLSLVSDDRLRQTLRLMGQPEGARVTPAIDQEVCQRSEGAAVIRGSISSLGSSYVLGLDAANCRTGDALSMEQLTAEGKAQVLKTLDAAAAGLRRKLGESLQTIEKYGTPIEQATTPSLEALQAFSLGLETKDSKGDEAAVPLFERAIQLDPRFAMAHALLGTSYSNLGERDRAAEMITTAYELREGVSEREAFYIDSYYHDLVRGDLDKARQIYEVWAQVYPRDDRPVAILGLLANYLGQYDKSVAQARAALALNPNAGLRYANLVQSAVFMRDVKGARDIADQALAKKLESPYLSLYLYQLAFLQDDAAGLATQVAWATGKPGVEDVLWAADASSAAYRGRLGKARELSQQAIGSARRSGSNETAASYAANAALRDAFFGNAAEARQQATAALALPTGRDVKVAAALALAMAGDVDRAQSLAAGLAKDFPDDTLVRLNFLPTINAQIALTRRDSARAIELLKVAAPVEVGRPGDASLTPALYPVYVRGEAYRAAGQGPEAVAEFQKILDHRAVVLNEPIGALAHLGLGRAYVLAGDSAKARAAYGDFLELWKDADPEVPVFKQAKAEYSRLR